MDVDAKAQKCGHCGAELNQLQKFIVGLVGMLVLYGIISNAYNNAPKNSTALPISSPTVAKSDSQLSTKTPTTTQTAVTNSASSEAVTNNTQKIAVIDVPGLLTKNLAQMKDELTKACIKSGVGAFNYKDTQDSKQVNCIINSKYNIYFELTSDGFITEDGIRFLGNTQYGDSEESVMAAAGVTKNPTEYSIVIKPADSTGSITLDVTKKTTQLQAQTPKELQEYYSKLIGYQAVIAKTYYDTTQKAANGDVAGAYLDFKGDAGDKISGGRQLLFELSVNVPDVPDKKLLEEAATTLSTGAYKLEEAMNLFKEGVENDSNGKILEATAASEKGVEYFNQASALLKQISSKYKLDNL